MAKRGLGKGLSALIADQDEPAAALAPAAKDSSVQKLPLSLIHPGRFQPRTHFQEEALSELSESVRKNGVVQPILVRSAAQGYEIIAGERRWRAAKMAGLHEVPAVLMDISDKQALEIALVENIQRRDLGPIEVAGGYQRLIDEFGYTQEELADVVGKSRSHVTNILRLLSLPQKVKELIAEEKLTLGHARALVGVEHAEAIAEEVVQGDLNVRQTEKLVQASSEFPRQQAKTQKKDGSKDPDILELERMVSKSLGLPVTIENRGEKGKVVITYQSLAQLDTVLRRLEPGETGEEAAA
jgi:ParB family chromosome partitioning protein